MGAEVVLRELIALYPDCDLFSVVDFLSDEDRRVISGKRAKTTFIQRLPFAKKKYRGYLPLMPLAIEQLDLSGYDLVISSSHAVAKGVITGPDQMHVLLLPHADTLRLGSAASISTSDRSYARPEKLDGTPVATLHAHLGFADGHQRR